MPGPKNNKNAQTHGGGAAIDKIRKGEPLTGLAAEAEQNAIAELENKGVDSMAERNAVRLQAASDLYWNAVLKAAQDNDLEALDRYVARFGWLAGCTLRALEQVKKARRDSMKKGVSIDAVIKSMEGEHDKKD